MTILDDILKELASYAANKLKEEVALLVGVPEEIEKLKEHLDMINAVLADAERRELEDEELIKNWLDKLRDIVYDIEDVHDDVQGVLSPKNEVKPGDNEEEEKKKVCFPSCIEKIKKIPRFCFKKIKKVKARHDIAGRMKEINGRLDEIARLKDQYKLEVMGRIDETRNERRITTAYGQFLPNLAAQTAIRNQVAEKLRGNQDGYNVQVISLVGMGGIGKTTIARMVFNDEAIRAQFHKLIWVCVSDHFSEMKVAKAIAQAIVDEKKGVAELNELQQVLEQINESIRTKKFFLVLDDVWTERDEKWDRIFDCLGACLPGSKVLVTTRSHRVAQKMKTDLRQNLLFKVPVDVLKEEECLLLFRYFAFSGRAEGEFQSLESIAKEMAKRCKGLPLAAETLGRAMAYKSTWEEWNDVLGSKLWDFEDVEKGLLPALSISYIDLPSPIKRCFSYCSIFQKDEAIEKKDLIRIWMGLGFLSSKAKGSRKMEDVGEEYLNSLVTRSFFQECKTRYDKEAVKMHDIIHDFAQYLTKNESLVFLGDGGGSRKIRHLNVSSRQAQLSTLSINMEYLRTLLLCGGDSSDDDYSDVLLKLSRARVLKLKGSMIGMIPSEIGKLTHLRYIDFSDCKELKELPESICDLSALETLDINGCTKLEKLPEGIGKLIHLRHLDASWCEELKELPESICDLFALETLGISCTELEKLPPLGRLPLLESLKIVGMDIIRNVGKEFLGIIEEDYQFVTSNSFVAFPKLRELTLIGLWQWTTWADDNIQFTIMPSLLDLRIEFCEKLQALPRFLAGAPIRKLEIWRCSLIEKSIEEGCEGYRWVSGIPICNLTFGDLLTGPATTSEEEMMDNSNLSNLGNRLLESDIGSGEHVSPQSHNSTHEFITEQEA